TPAARSRTARRDRAGAPAPRSRRVPRGRRRTAPSAKAVAAAIRRRSSGTAPSRPALPPRLGHREILERVELHVAARRVHTVELGAALDHALEEVDEIRLLERAIAERRAVRLRVVVGLAELLRARGGELRDADELAGGLLRFDGAVHLDDARALGAHLLRVGLG